MSDYQYIRKKFESAANPAHHSVITVEDLNETVRDSRRVSLKTLDWLSGKVEAMRRKFSAAASGNKDDSEIIRVKKQINARKISIVDGDLIEICNKYQICGANKYTWVGEPFESLVSDFGRLIRTDQIEVHHDENEVPKGILLLPLSSSTGQALLDFTEMGGFSLGRGSRVAKRASRALSRNHCMIYLEDNRVFIKDCDSKTGTFVCGRLLGSSIPTELSNFDIIQMGYGVDNQDFVQSMVIFLSKWNKKEFATSIQHLNSDSMFSRTFSNSVHDLKLQDDKIETNKYEKRLTPSPMKEAFVVSSPKLTDISKTSNTGSSKKADPIKSSPTYEEDTDEESERETIIFERPRFSTKEPPKMAIHSAPPRQQSNNSNVLTYEPLQYETNSNHGGPSKVTSPIKTQPVESPKVMQSYPVSKGISPHSSNRTVAPLILDDEDSNVITSARPPIPKPRRTHKNLSKSAECLIEIELSEMTKMIDEPSPTKQDNVERTSPSHCKTVKKMMPIQAALTARKSSLPPQIVNIEIPAFLKLENMKIPSISPAFELLKCSGIVKRDPTNSSKFNLPFSKKRQNRLEKFKNQEAQFHTLVQGAQMRRFETFVDFGSATSDISDGISSVRCGGTESFKSVFNNFKLTWAMESINQSTGAKVLLRPFSRSGNHYDLFYESVGKETKIAGIELDLKTNFQLKVSFKLDDESYKTLTGNEIDSKESLPLKALEQLSFFYPHLEVPTLQIQGLPDAENSISLVTNNKVQRIGKILFESQSISWSRRLMNYAVDLDSSIVDLDSLLADTIQSVALLYCLRYHVDY